MMTMGIMLFAVILMAAVPFGTFRCSNVGGYAKESS